METDDIKGNKVVAMATTAEEIAYLQSKKIALEDLVRRFENNNEEYSHQSDHQR